MHLVRLAGMCVFSCMRLNPGLHPYRSTRPALSQAFRASPSVTLSIVHDPLHAVFKGSYGGHDPVIWHSRSNTRQRTSTTRQNRSVSYVLGRPSVRRALNLWEYCGRPETCQLRSQMKTCSARTCRVRHGGPGGRVILGRAVVSMDAPS
jgi:hypothetical protein